MATQRLLTRALNVAEKASVAREISRLLNPGCRSVTSLSKFNPIYKFDYATEAFNADMRFTSVRGHLKQLLYEDPRLKMWHTYDPRTLIKAKTNLSVKGDVQAIIENLQKEAAEAQMLILWLDCDMEGEAIAKQVEEVCLSANPRLKVQRARFSALTRSDVGRAVHNLTSLDNNQIMAVWYRQQLDLRIGCTLTNFQTLAIGKAYNIVKQGSPLTYGTCQIPLLALIVDDYISKKRFQPQKYWEIDICCTVNQSSEDLWFHWQGAKIEKLSEAEEKYNSLPSNQVILEVSEVTTETCKKMRPLPHTTSSLLKQATSKLKMTSAQVMAAAQALYRQGIISYPRTQTNRFHPSINLTNYVMIQLKNEKFSRIAQKLLQKGVHPRFGNQNDQAHSPIYPSKVPEKALQPHLNSLYDLIVENFLLCLSQDAQYVKKTIVIGLNDMNFSMEGNQIISEGYLAFSSSDKLRTKNMPNLQKGDKLFLKRSKMHTKNTTQPPKLTESLLITKMEQNKIGTDSTIHEHIRNIQQRGYAIKADQFTPTKLGLGLINGYREIDSQLCSTQLRAEMESNVKQISEGTMNYEEALSNDLVRFEEIYTKLEKSKEEFLLGFNKILKAAHKLTAQIASVSSSITYNCDKCQTDMQIVVDKSSKFLQCNQCKIRYSLPQRGEITATGKKCHECSWQVLDVKDQKGNSYNLCPQCFNNPKPHMSTQVQRKLPCFKCIIEECAFSQRFQSKGISACPTCNHGRLVVKRSNKTGGFLVGCTKYPQCLHLIPLDNRVTKVFVTEEKCSKCSQNGADSLRCELTINQNGEDVKNVVCLQKNCGDRKLLSI